MLPYCMNISTFSDKDITPTPLLSFPTLPGFLNFSTIFVIVFLHGVFLPGISLRNSIWVRTTDFVEKWLSNIFQQPFVYWKLDCNIHLDVKQLLQVLLVVSLKIKSRLLFSLKIYAKKNRDSFVGHPVKIKDF